jgi:predicted transcriptional regulator
MSHMATLTVRIDPQTERQLDDLVARSGRSRSEILRDALRRELAVARFDQLRREVLPFAEARGYLSDEDVFRALS